jgi:hypothetical protein
VIVAGGGGVVALNTVIVAGGGGVVALNTVTVAGGGGGGVDEVFLWVVTWEKEAVATTRPRSGGQDGVEERMAWRA